MENNNIEKDIKRLFDQHQPTLDTDQIWDAIEPELEKKKKRRFFIFWLWGGGLMLLSGLLYHYYSPGNFFTVSPQKEIADIRNKDQEVAAHNVLEEKVANENQSSEFLPDEGKSPEEEQTPVIAAANPSANALGVRYRNNTLKRSLTPNETNSRIPEASPTNSPAVATPPDKEEQQSPEEMINQSSLEKKDLTEKGTITQDSLDRFPLTSRDKTATGKDEQTKNTKVEKTKKKRRKKKRKKIKPLRKTNWEVQFQTSLSPILGYKKLTNRKNFEFGNPDYLEERKESEKQLEAFGYTTSLHFQHKRTGLTLMSGIEFRQFNERFKNELLEETTSIEIGILTVTEDQDGNIINTTTGPKLVTTTKIVEQRLYNRHRFISIPIGIGKSWNRKKNGWKLMGGLTYNLLYSFKGTIYNTSLEPLHFQKDRNSSRYNAVFKSSTGFDIWFSGEYNRAINSRLSWLFAPRLQVPLGSTTPSDYQVKQNFFALQFDVGINYLLNPKKKTKKKSRRKKQ